MTADNMIEALKVDTTYDLTSSGCTDAEIKYMEEQARKRTAARKRLIKAQKEMVAAMKQAEKALFDC